MSLSVKNYYTISGRLSRADFFWHLLVIMALLVSIHFSFMPVLHQAGELNNIILFHAALQFAGLVLATPLLVKRFHDLNSSGWWASIYWVSFLFSIEVSAIIKNTIGFVFNPISEFNMFLALFEILVFAVLLFKRGNTGKNEYGNPNKQINLDAKHAAQRHV